MKKQREDENLGIQSKVDSLKEESQVLKLCMSELQNSYDAEKESCNILKLESEKVVSELKHQISDLKVQNEELKDKLKSEAAEYEKELIMIKDEHKRKDIINQLKATLENETAENKEEIVKLKDNLKNEIDKKLELEKMFSELKYQVSNLTVQTELEDRLKSEAAEHEKKLITVKNEHDKQKDTSKIINQLKTTLENKTADHEEEIIKLKDNLKDEINKHETKINDLKLSMENNASMHEEKIVNLKHDFDVQISSLADENQELKASLNDSSCAFALEIETLKQQSQQMKNLFGQKITSMTEKNDVLKLKYDECVCDLQIHIKHKMICNETVANLQDKNHAMQSKIDILTKENADLDSKVCRYYAEIKTNESCKIESDKMKNHFKEKISNLSLEINKLKTSIKTNAAAHKKMLNLVKVSYEEESAEMMHGYEERISSSHENLRDLAVSQSEKEIHIVKVKLQDEIKECEIHAKQCILCRQRLSICATFVVACLAIIIFEMIL